MTTLGWIGMGDIGTPMALRLLDAGHELVVWGRTASRLAPAIARGARAVNSPAEVAMACDAIFVCITDTDAVESVVFGPAGIAEGGAPGRLVIDHSTSDVARTRDFASRLRRERTMGYLDAPVSGGAAGARAGTLSILIGGDAADIERARPWLAAYGHNITHLGPSGAGQAAKSCNQVVFAAAVAAWVEVLPYARALGLDVSKLSSLRSMGAGPIRR